MAPEPYPDLLALSLTPMRRRDVLTMLISTAATAALRSPALHAAGTVVTGTVSGSDQGFLTGARVVVEASQRREATTDADGRFTFADIAPGRYRLLVTAEGYLPLDRPMDVGTASVSMDIVLLRLPGV
jgi:hypothetical protein